MFNVDKPVYDLSIASNTDESLSRSTDNLIPKKEREKNPNKSLTAQSEQLFPTIDESAAFNTISDELIHTSAESNSSEDSKNSYFKIILFEQGLKAFAIFYMAITFVASIVFLCRQISMNADVANITWLWVGLIKAIISMSIVILVVWYKIMLTKNKHYTDRVQPENALFFYTCVVIPSAAPWIFYFIEEVHNIQNYGRCVKLPDLVIPITQMIFITIVVMTISDLIFFRIKNDVPTKFYLVYKSAATLVFTNSVTCLIFNVFDMESQVLQKQIANWSLITCYKMNNATSYVSSLSQILQVFMIIFYISAVTILFKPLQQFSIIFVNTPVDNKSHNSTDINETESLEKNHEYDPISLIIALILCILCVIVIPLDLMKTDNSDMKDVFLIIFNVLPLCIYVVIGFSCLYLLRLLYKYSPIRYEVSTSLIDSFIIWISLLGELISCFKDIINSSQFISAERSKSTVHTLLIVLRCGTIIQSILQAMLINFINKMEKTYILDKKTFNKISCPAVILIASNFGFFIINWYLVSGSSSIKSYTDDFNIIQWNFLGSISYPFTLLFRGYSVLYIMQFLSKLRCRSEN